MVGGRRREHGPTCARCGTWQTGTGVGWTCTECFGEWFPDDRVSTQAADEYLKELAPELKRLSNLAHKDEP